MSKKLQITISDETYEKLLRLCNETGSPLGWSKSSVIDIAIFDLYQRIDLHGVWNEWDSGTRIIKE